MAQNTLRSVQFKERLKGHEDTIMFLNMSKQKILTSVSIDHNLRIWDLNKREIVKKLFLEKERVPIEKEKDEEADESFAQISEQFQKKVEVKDEEKWQMKCICKDEESEEYFVGFSNGEVVRYSLDSEYNQRAEVVAVHESEIQTIAFLKGHLVYSTAHGLLIIQNFLDNYVKTFSTHKQFNFILLNPLAQDKDNNFGVQLFCIVNRQRLVVMNPNLENPIEVEIECNSQVISCSIHQEQLYLGSVDKKINIYKIVKQGKETQVEPLTSINNLDGWPNRIQVINTSSITQNSPYQFIKDVHQMLVVGCEKKVYFFDNNQQELLEICEGHKDSIIDMLYDEGSNLIYTAGFDKLIIIRVWDLQEIIHKIMSNYSMYREDIQSRQNMVYQVALTAKKKGKGKKKKKA